MTQPAMTEPDPSELTAPRECAYCGLPIVARWWSSGRAVSPAVGGSPKAPRTVNQQASIAPEPEYCCFGCRFAAEVAGERGEQGEANSTLFRLGLAIFLTLNVVMFTMALWTQDVYGADADEAVPLALSLGALFRYLALVLSLPVLWLLGRPLAANALGNLRDGRPSTDLLLVAGVAASFAFSAVSVVRGAGHVYFEVGCVVLLMVTLGRWLEATGKLKATSTLDALEKLLPADVRLVAGGAERNAPVAEVRARDRLRVLAGERFATDGRIVRGRAAVDQQVFTGESAAVVKEPGDTVLAGTLDLDGELLVEVTVAHGACALDRLIAVVHEARAAKGAYQRLADRIAAAFLPAVALLAVGSAVWHGMAGGFEQGVLNGLTVVLIACPCALGLATPLAVWAALGRAAAGGVLFRHGDALERLAQARAIAFDKTGTLTSGTTRVLHFVADEPTGADFVLERATAVAAGSTHSFSNAIVDFARGRKCETSGDSDEFRGKDAGIGSRSFCRERPLPARRDSANCESKLPALAGTPRRAFPTDCGGSRQAPVLAERATELRTLPGRGLVAHFDEGDETVYLGSPRLMNEAGLSADGRMGSVMNEWHSAGHSLVCVGWQGQVRGMFAFDEQLRDEAREALAACHRALLHVVVLTGDATMRTARLCDELKVPATGGLLPEDKVTALGCLRDRWGAVAMVGDGINDAPALAASDVGIALGCGTDVARQSADVCLLGNDLRRVAWSVGLAQAAVRTIRQNLFWAFAYNALGIGLAVTGRLNPVLASMAMVASSLMVIGNSLKLTRWTGAICDRH
ncbi:MAG TPA: cation-translocating P-type ATPase [Pirellulales bacterium]|nr:cation-translocating P-type ATPase [Pirellulales bacterium]